jgi:hypothetical protein
MQWGGVGLVGASSEYNFVVLRVHTAEFRVIFAFVKVGQ